MFSSQPGFSKCWWVFRIIVHILLLGPVFRWVSFVANGSLGSLNKSRFWNRYIDLLYYGIKSRKSRLQRVNIQGPYCPWPKQQAELKKQVDYYNLLLHEERDISILELMHSFMQDAPQLILQLYILAKRPPESKSENDYIITGKLHNLSNFQLWAMNQFFIASATVLVQSFSSLTSLLSLAWSLTCYQRTLRYAMPDKPQMSVGGSATLFSWHTCQVAARVLALALFANAYKQEVFIVLGGHWALMTIWILAQVFWKTYSDHPILIRLSRSFVYSGPISVALPTERGRIAKSFFTTSSLDGYLHSSWSTWKQLQLESNTVSTTCWWQLKILLW